MEIKTKFKIGDVAWFISSDHRLNVAKIAFITIYIRSLAEIEISYRFEDEKKELIGFSDEKYLFLSKEEALKYIEKK